MTKERPILFSGAMVRAILDGRKTQTRRVVKGFPRELLEPDNFTPEYVAMPENGFSPYGFAGDRLWVRETWGFNPDFPGIHRHACYRADPGHEYDGIKWKPSIHMPRAVCRLKLEITGVRVERLNDCSVKDAIAEGAEPVLPDPLITQACPEDYRVGYRQLWDSINGAGAWEANPWVWVVEFKRMVP